MGNMSKGFGPETSPGQGRGAFSTKQNMAPVPKKGSSLKGGGPLMGPDAMKVQEMSSKASMRENLRGKAG